MLAAVGRDRLSVVTFSQGTAECSRRFCLTAAARLLRRDGRQANGTQRVRGSERSATVTTRESWARSPSFQHALGNGKGELGAQAFSNAGQSSAAGCEDPASSTRGCQACPGLGSGRRWSSAASLAWPKEVLQARPRCSPHTNPRRESRACPATNK